MILAGINDKRGPGEMVVPDLPDEAGRPKAEQASQVRTKEGWGYSHFTYTIGKTN
jgi:hypothetical protein